MRIFIRGFCNAEGASSGPGLYDWDVGILVDRQSHYLRCYNRHWRRQELCVHHPKWMLVQRHLQPQESPEPYLA